jgi:casein kinase 1 alpha
MAQDLSNGELVAVKVEDNLIIKHPQLFHEARLLKALKGKGIPELKGALIEGDYNVMIISLLGNSLEDLFKK